MKGPGLPSPIPRKQTAEVLTHAHLLWPETKESQGAGVQSYICPATAYSAAKPQQGSQVTRFRRQITDLE